MEKFRIVFYFFTEITSMIFLDQLSEELASYNWSPVLLNDLLL